ncbi:MAG: hypothetical protein U0414_42505, partial [Polyangiaceae bacterium]
IAPMKHLHGFAFASVTLTLALLAGCETSVEDATGGAGTGTTTSTTKASSGTTTGVSTTTGSATTTGASMTGSSSSGMTTPQPFPCGPNGLTCDASKEYCEEMEGVVVSYACKPHAICPGLGSVDCSCLDVAGMNCNSCMAKGGGAVLNCGQG